MESFLLSLTPFQALALCSVLAPVAGLSIVFGLAFGAQIACQILGKPCLSLASED